MQVRFAKADGSFVPSVELPRVTGGLFNQDGAVGKSPRLQACAEGERGGGRGGWEGRRKGRNPCGAVCCGDYYACVPNERFHR